MVRKIQGYGWIPDHPDQRDYRFVAPTAVLRALPRDVDLRPACPPVYRQGSLGSCTANAVAAAIQFDQMKQRRAAAFAPSRLFIYYNTRVLERTVNSDSGSMIRDAIKSVSYQGVCPELMWPYDPATFRIRPSSVCYEIAAWHKAIRYERLSHDLAQMKGCLAAGYPFAIGITAYESFETPEVASSGNVPLPNAKESVTGSHSMLAVGYDDTCQHFLVRNSYGTEWGMRGYCTLPYAYLTGGNLAGDFWTIRVVQ